MIFIKPSYEILTNIDGEKILKNIEKIARLCYKSENKINDDSAKVLIKSLISRDHTAMIEHESISVKFICDRGVSHEIVRHRLASFAQESTRYCNYSNKEKFGNHLSVIVQPGMNPDEFTPHYANFETIVEEWFGNTLMDHDAIDYWLFANCVAEFCYLSLIRKGWTPEQARSVLPTDIKTEIVVTANLREWRNIFKLRTAKAAHPQMRELMIPLLNEFKEKIPIIFDDIIPD